MKVKNFQGVSITILDDEEKEIGSIEVKFNDHKPLKENYDFESIREAAEKLFNTVINIMSE